MRIGCEKSFWITHFQFDSSSPFYPIVIVPYIYIILYIFGSIIIAVLTIVKKYRSDVDIYIMIL